MIVYKIDFSKDVITKSSLELDDPWSKVIMGYKPNVGKTLFAKQFISQDELILKIAGPIIAYPTIYTIPISLDQYIDPYPVNLPGKYLCHSCDPSAGIKQKSLLVARRDIKPGEEVVIDYAMIGYEYGDELPPNQRTCFCGNPRCRGTLGCWKDLPDSLKKEYRPYTSEYLLNLNNFEKSN